MNDRGARKIAPMMRIIRHTDLQISNLKSVFGKWIPKSEHPHGRHLWRPFSKINHLFI
jgi:hypothetical protein